MHVYPYTTGLEVDVLVGYGGRDCLQKCHCSMPGAGHETLPWHLLTLEQKGHLSVQILHPPHFAETVSEIPTCV